MEEYSIDLHDNNELEELVGLTKEYYKEGDIIDPEYLQWQYFNNPAGNAIIYTARSKSNNELAGQYIVIPLNFNFFGEKLYGSLSLNTLTHPKHQGKGLFTKLALATYDECKNKKIGWTIGFPNPNSYPGFIRKLDFKHLGVVPLMIKPLKPLGILKGFRNRNKKRHGGLIDLEFHSKSGIILLDTVDAVQKNMLASFLNFCNKKSEIGTWKDMDYIQWRYLDIPSRKYYVIGEVANNSIVSVAIIKAGEVLGSRAGIIMDLLYLKGHQPTALMNYLSEIGKKNKLDLLMTMNSSLERKKIFRKHTFFTVPQRFLPQKTHFIVRMNINDNEHNKIFELSHWNLSFGDYDVF